MGFNLSARSVQRLEGVHPHLVDVVKLAIQRTAVDFTVVEGWAAEPARACRQGSQPDPEQSAPGEPDGYGRAVDLAPLVGGAIPWDNWEVFRQQADVVKACAAELGTLVEWGGDWKTRTGRISSCRAAGRRRHDRRRREAAGRAGRLARLRGGRLRGCRRGLDCPGLALRRGDCRAAAPAGRRERRPGRRPWPQSRRPEPRRGGAQPPWRKPVMMQRNKPRLRPLGC